MDSDEEIADPRETSMSPKPEDIGVDSTSRSNNIQKQNKISELIDTDSEDDDTAFNDFDGSSENHEPLTKPYAETKKGKVKRTGSIRSSKEKAMREIHSETQRMLRESQVRLPYHRPKQHTLQEFLNRRKTLPVLPSTLTTAEKMKMSGEIIRKVWEEREKEVKLFYKSSSESDTETETDTQVESAIANKPAIEETQKIGQNDPKNNFDIKEIIEQGDKNLRVPQKLFDCSDEYISGNTETPIDINDSNEAIKENQDCNQKSEEFKRGLKDAGISRKLFVSDCVETLNTGNHNANTIYEIPEKSEKIQEICETHNSQVKVSVEPGELMKQNLIDMTMENSEKQKNESMEEEVENFELKMSEDPYEIIKHNTAVKSTVISTTIINDFKSITETPSIINQELSKLNETEETDSTNGKLTHDGDKIFSENERPVSVNSMLSSNNEDSKDNDEPAGHVYGLPLPDFEDKPKCTKTQLFPEIMTLTPKLTGIPGMVIELSPPKVGVNKLIKRFLNHSVTNKTPESSPEVTTIRTEQTSSGLTVINEVLPYRLSINEKNDDPELSKPGAKLTRLKKDLQEQIAIQRTKEWTRKELEMKNLETDDIYSGERDDCGKDILEDEDEEEEEEEGEQETSEGEESELEEDDVPIKEKQNKYKSSFVDGEAEVSGEDEEDEEEDEEGASEIEDREDGDSNNSCINDNQTEEYDEQETDASQKNKTFKLKRIAKAFDDEDSDDAETIETDRNTNDASHERRLRRTKTDVDMFATDNNSNDDWLSGSEGELPVYQQRIDERSQSCATPSVTNNSLSMVSPIIQLTALNTGSESVNRNSISARNSLQSIVSLSIENTPIEVKSHRECDSKKLEKLQKKLFDDTKEAPTDTELMGLCSGQFSDNPSNNEGLDILMNTSRKSNVSDTELMDLCSGKFVTQPPEIEELEAESERIQGSLPSPCKFPEEQSQKPDTSSSKAKIVFSSDDEDDTDNLKVKDVRKRNLKKKVRKLNLSDDEEESNHDSLSDLDEQDNGENEFVDYDSEENEIVVPKQDVRKTAAGFLDEEAELSESDWGSADEDERDLDKLDAEEGDLEDIDQDQVKKQLEKIHMRQVLDKDQREVRLLQEILLEDGELHSENGSRQRKFKWKHIDELDKDNAVPLRDIGDENISVDPNEAERELEWRKQRLKREQFLQELRGKEAAADVEQEKEDSQLFQLGMEALKKSQNTKVSNDDIPPTIIAEKPQTSLTRHTVADLFASPGNGTKTSALRNAIHRGSFLARGEESLARLSLITKQNNEKAVIMTKTSRNFVFTHLSPAIEGAVEDGEFESHENTSNMDTKKRKRKPPLSLTPKTVKKSKKEYERSDIRSKLFN